MLLVNSVTPQLNCIDLQFHNAACIPQVCLYGSILLLLRDASLKYDLLVDLLAVKVVIETDIVGKRVHFTLTIPAIESLEEVVRLKLIMSTARLILNG